MSKEPENMQINSSTGHLTEPWQSTVSSHNLWKNCLKMCSFDILGSPWMFFGGGWHCTYSCLHRSHNTHWLTAHSPPMLTNTQACQKILKTHIFGNLYIFFFCVVFLTDLITILHFNSCYMLHLWITARLHVLDRISGF